MPDFYQTLGVSKNASQEDIKVAFRKLALEHHPDRNIGNKEAEAKFKEISDAYSVLSDPKKKAEYDRKGYVGARPAFRQQNWQQAFKNIFEQHFASRPEHGQHIEVRVELELKDVIQDTKKTVSVTRSSICEVCSGLGGKSTQNCTGCQGLGLVTLRQGATIIQMTCSTCQGKGSIIKEVCATCLGHGVTAGKPTNVEVNIPKGIRNGMRVRLTGLGEPGRSGVPNGDLYVVVFIKPHPFYQVVGDDLHCDLWLTYTNLVNGTSLTLPMLDGTPLDIAIPKRMSPHNRLRIAGKGLPGRSGVGDIIASVKLALPDDTISEEYNDLLDTLLVQESMNPGKEQEQFLRKLDELLGE